MPAQVLQESTPASIVSPTKDSSLQSFTNRNFDPVSFLNDSLPSTSLSSTLPTDQTRSKIPTLQDVSAQTQAFVAKLNTQNIRFASSLSQLTDEILRNGSRLAYEVEILRGNANALHENLTDTLQEDIQKFTLVDATTDGKHYGEGEEQRNQGGDSSEPEIINQLRMLGQVRARLEEVINVFGEAMKWPIPPSELSLTSSFISVSAPEPGSDNHSQEETGKRFAREARAEIVQLLTDGSDGPSIEAAAAKIDALRLLSTVWKGTTEERARNKLVDSLAKPVEDKRRQVEARLLSQAPSQTNTTAPQSNLTPGRAPAGASREGQGGESGVGGGLLRNLQRLRDEIYLD